ncbi:MAG: Protein smf [Nocardia sp.]|uniref:Rv3235 family protein n=1 Tax=Nocardia sp. TaxID=1821 RepID=UPI002626C69C|nr:Rv3235 family protein [Nocardia sp.]MCU1642950.1 Protein smf [Nocardia sp.]
MSSAPLIELVGRGGDAETAAALHPETFPVRIGSGEIHQQLWHLLSRLVEVINHRRPAMQLRGLLSEKVLAGLLTRARCAQGRYRLHSLHACRCAENVIEFCATVWVTDRRDRSRALTVAGRLERQRDRWVATELRSPHNGH